MQTEIEILQNAANDLGIVIHQKQYEDKRQKIKKYFATINGTTKSPVLDYWNMNHFLLGWRNCLKQLNNL
jgi:hypothetical protein